MTPFFKRTSFISESEAGKPEDVRDIGKRLFEHYSCLTHASMYSQQIPIKSKGFYLNVKECHAELGLWILCLMEVADSYWRRRLLEPDIVDDKQFVNCVFYNLILESYAKERYKLKQLIPGLEDSAIISIFRDYRWVIKGQ